MARVSVSLTHRLNEAGLVQEMSVLWRPLPAVVAALNKLRLADGEAALELRMTEP